ncbi:hypothetical protein [Streptomyces peucetius]|uniref:Uncharacterized protein n=1 Tax=Streptomyces peucetius TaxID=1950 RepID=A0ABY6IAG9_STRPE|nr:hypothetical protein [Streptomyces peucetius]UYQ62852.1 hypothetical protein OGH68_16095 [Streptomyces peucetius]
MSEDGSAVSRAADGTHEEHSARPPGPLSGVLGRTPFTLERMGGLTVLRVGDRETVIGPDTRVRHRAHLLWNTFRVERAGRPLLVHRYRLPWVEQLLGQFETAPDFFVAQDIDPGLELTVALGGESAWVLSEAGKH